MEKSIIIRDGWKFLQVSKQTPCVGVIESKDKNQIYDFETIEAKRLVSEDTTTEILPFMMSEIKDKIYEKQIEQEKQNQNKGHILIIRGEPTLHNDGTNFILFVEIVMFSELKDY